MHIETCLDRIILSHLYTTVPIGGSLVGYHHDTGVQQVYQTKLPRADACAYHTRVITLPPRRPL